MKTEAAKALLRKAVADFRRWAAAENYPEQAPSAEWETLYEGWPALTTAVIDLLDACDASVLDRDTSLDLIYALARDNELELFREELVARPAHLFSLVEIAMTSGDSGARWQMADALGDVQAPDDCVAPFLELFVQDADEYVSRRALLALARRESADIESWAIRAWETDHEYQRIAALHVLAAKASPLLEHYLAEAEIDGRTHLVHNAKELRCQAETPDA